MSTHFEQLKTVLAQGGTLKLLQAARKAELVAPSGKMSVNIDELTFNEFLNDAPYINSLIMEQRGDARDQTLNISWYEKECARCGHTLSEHAGTEGCTHERHLEMGGVAIDGPCGCEGDFTE